MTDISQNTCQNAISCKDMFVFDLKYGEYCSYGYSTLMTSLHWPVLEKGDKAYFLNQWWIRSPAYLSVMRIYELVQERRISSALAMELRLSCIKPSIWR